MNQGPTPSSAYYDVELRLAPSREAASRPEIFTVILDDRQMAEMCPGDAHLGFAEEDLGGLGIKAGQFLKSFNEGDPCGLEEGLAFGRLLLNRLLETPQVGDLWARIMERRNSTQRPLRLQMIFPRGELANVAGLPFELLADETGFLFRSFRFTLVRTIKGIPGETAMLCRGDKAGVVWANPEEKLAPHIFQDHEEAMRDMGPRLGLAVVEPCRAATRDSLRDYIEGGKDIALISMIAHGRASPP